MRKRTGSIDGLLLVAFFLLLTILTVGAFLAKDWRPRVASEHGRGVDGMITYILIASGIIFVIGHLVLVAFVWRARRQENGPLRTVSRRTEMLWVLIPVLTMTLISEGGVLLIGMPVWGKVYGETPKDALVVEVVAKQFEWVFRYPGPDGKFGRVDPNLVDSDKNPVGLDPSDPAAKDDIVLRTLTIPAGRHVLLRLHSHDVIHSFSVPEFRVKQDVIPGFTATTQFVATDVGRYEVACVELCGLGHFRMRSVVTVKSKADFENWLKDQVGWLE